MQWVIKANDKTKGRVVTTRAEAFSEVKRLNAAAARLGYTVRYRVRIRETIERDYHGGRSPHERR